ncbi:MAG: hypothetical protein ACI4PM_05925 [Butyricicoccus sp.]
MIRILRNNLLFLLLLFSVWVPSRAAELPSVSSAQQDMTSGMTGESKSILGDLTADDCTNLTHVLCSLWDNTVNQTQGILKNAILTVTKTGVILILCGCASGFSSGSQPPSFVLTMAGALGITTAVSGDLSGMMSLCRSSAEELSVLSNSMLPVIMTAVSLNGMPATGGILQAGTVFALNFCLTLITSVLLPAVSAYIAMITVNAALGNGMLTRLADFLRWMTSGTLKLLVTVFIAYITVFGSLSQGVDRTTVRAAKFAVSGAVPVVGGILSSAAETVLANAAVLKNTVGLFGIVCVAAVCLVPFLRLGISYLLFRAGSAILSPLSPTPLLSLMDGITNSFGLILGMLGSCSAIVFFELFYTIAFLTGS